MTSWQIERAEHGSSKCNSLLAEGWEPFGVTDVDTIWLRRAFPEQ